MRNYIPVADGQEPTDFDAVFSRTEIVARLVKSLDQTVSSYRRDPCGRAPALCHLEDLAH